MDNKIKQIADNYGEKQINQTIEECSELILALSKYLRKNKTDETELIKNITDEIADVEIMTSQLKYIFSVENNVQKRKQFKIDRQLRRIKYDTQ